MAVEMGGRSASETELRKQTAILKEQSERLDQLMAFASEFEAVVSSFSAEVVEMLNDQALAHIDSKDRQLIQSGMNKLADRFLVPLAKKGVTVAAKVAIATAI